MSPSPTGQVFPGSTQARGRAGPCWAAPTHLCLYLPGCLSRPCGYAFDADLGRIFSQSGTHIRKDGEKEHTLAIAYTRPACASSTLLCAPGRITSRCWRSLPARSQGFWCHACRPTRVRRPQGVQFISRRITRCRDPASHCCTCGTGHSLPHPGTTLLRVAIRNAGRRPGNTNSSRKE